MPGTLFVVATPIGNLEDLTFRALRTLREVDLIAAEDTRRTAKLLAHYEVRNPMVSLREHNEARETPRLVSRLLAGENIALVSDAGTPTIADPGARLVRAAHGAAIRVVPIPGPSAVVAALSVSGFSGDRFTFMGFAPPKGSARTIWLKRLADEAGIAVFFESPHRIRRTVAEVTDICYGKRQIIACREITKQHEELVMSANLLANVRDQGEFVVVVGPIDKADSRSALPQPGDVASLFCRLTDSSPIDELTATGLVAIRFSVTADEVRKIVKKHKILVDRQSWPAS